jgi:hypothetical protein
MSEIKPAGQAEPVKEPAVRTWQTRGRLWGMPISIIAIWAALFVAASAVPALPVPGMAGMITMNAILTSIAGVVLGPAAGLASMVGGILSTILFPYGAFFGPLSFVTVTVGALIAGLTFANHWKLAGLLEVLVVLAWYVNPRAWQPWMWIVPLPYTLVALLVIFIGPLRNWARKQIITTHKTMIWPAMFLMASVGHSAEYLTSNDMTNWMFNLTWQYWVPTWPYWVGVDTVIIVLSTIVGVGVLIGLRRARLIQAADIFNT